MTYLGELRRNIRPLAAASIGCGSGLMVAAYATSVFAPYLLRQFGWSRSQFALIGLTMFSTLLVMPFIGRLTDRLGVRRMALAGALLLPLPYIGYSFMQGSFAVFLLISATVLALGSLTGPAVYTRLIAENFTHARGLALTIVTCAPAVVGALAAPALTAINEDFGWRWGYRAFALWILAGNLVASLLVPRQEPGLDHTPSILPLPTDAPATKNRSGAFREILRQPAFWVIAGAMVLCSVPTPLHSSQMNVMLLDAGLNARTAALMVSTYAVGTVLGRIACGLSLDRFRPAHVATLWMALPAGGYALIAAAHGAHLPIAGGMALIGLAMGADNDLTAFLVARHFRLEVFSTALSLVLCGVLFAAACGAMLLSAVLRHGGGFTLYLQIVSVTALVGALLFLALPRRGVDAAA
jgi:MFS family permease